jgi:N-acetylmuramoyl-L-alanine amidase
MHFSNLHINKFRGILFTIFLVAMMSPGVSQEHYTLVEAQKGDGIFTLLRRHGLQPGQYFDEFIILNKPDLGANNALFSGRMYKLPVQATGDAGASLSSPTVVRDYAVFGEKYREVALLSDELQGAVYYLVAGHGGPDPGAVGRYGSYTLCEDEYAYDVTLRLARNLMEKGATVYLITRDPNDGIRDEQFLKPDKDEVCYPNLSIPLNQNARLRQRKDAVNNLYLKNRNAFQRVIIVHVDSRSRGENIDVFFYHDRRSNTGHKAAKILQQTFSQKYRENQPGRGYRGTVSSRGLYMVRNTYPVAVYIELGNINHARDQRRFIVTNNRQALANWLTLGLVKDFQTNK